MINSKMAHRISSAISRLNFKNVYRKDVHRHLYILSTNVQSQLPSMEFRQNCYDFKYNSIVPQRFYSDLNRKGINMKIAKSKQIITDNIEEKRMRMRERKEILVQGIRDKKTKVQEKVKEMEEIVERENILTIPNLLCVARSFLAPYIGHVIICGNYELAIGLLAIAGITDLVRY